VFSFVFVAIRQDRRIIWASIDRGSRADTRLTEKFASRPTAR
jgi:hypothetical protein